VKTKRQLDEAVRGERAAVLLVNTHSRRGRYLYEDALRALEKREIEVPAAYAVTDPRRLLTLAHEARSVGPTLVIVGGGDGTVSEVVDAFAYSDSVLGYLPLGTSNYFGKALGIPRDLEHAVDVAVNGRLLELDLARADDDYFAGVASLGLSVSVAMSTSRRQKRFLGRLAYALQGMRELRRAEPFQVKVTADGKASTYRARQVAVVNADANWKKPTPTLREEPAGEQGPSSTLYCYVLQGESSWRLASGLISYGLRRVDRLTAAERIEARELLLEAEPRQCVGLDGEIKGRTPVTLRLSPRALRVMAPTHAAD
jgi:diacylglycerol kinase (ATP)